MFSDKQRYDTIKNKFNDTFRSKLPSSSSLMSFKKDSNESNENDAGSTLLQRNINLIPDQIINIEETEVLISQMSEAIKIKRKINLNKFK